MQRCQWITGQPDFYVNYHDHEWGKPIHDDQKLFACLVLELFQAGLSFKTILNKRANFQTAFAHFAIAQVAQFTATDVERLMQDAGIVRHRAKILAAITNAQCIVKLQGQGQTFTDFVWQFVDNQVIDHQITTMAAIPTSIMAAQQLQKALKQAGFKFVGEKTVYAFMQAAGLVNDHEITCAFHG